MEVATFHANGSTDPSQNLHGRPMLFSNRDGHSELKTFIEVPKGGAHFVSKTKKGHFGQKEALDKKGALIKVVQHLKNSS